MEYFAHKLSTGIPMSTKGTVDHLYSSTPREGTPELNSEAVNDVYDHKNAISGLFSDISRENGDCFMSSLQDGDQSQLFYNIVYSSDLPVGENGCIPLLKSSEDGSSIKCARSAISDLCRDNLYAMDVVVQDMGDPLEGIHLSVPDYKFSVRDTEGHKKLNESISAVTKSMDMENLLPEIFQEETHKDSTPARVGQRQHSNLMLDENVNVLGKDVLELEIPITSAWPGEDSFDLAYGLITVKEKNEKSATTNDSCTSYVICAEDVITQNTRFPNAPSVSSIKGNQKAILEGSSKNSSGSEISGPVLKGISDSSSNKYASFTLDNNSKEISDCNNQIPLVHISEKDDSMVLNLSGNDGKVQIIVSTEDGKQIFELDKELASSLNIINSIEQVASENGFCPNGTSDRSNHLELSSLKNSSASTETSCKSDLLAIVEKLSASRSKCMNWVCNVKGCGKVMERERQLKLHMMAHEGEKPYKCPNDGCEWSFTTLYRLRRHKNSHIGNKDYPCDFENCNKSFTTVYNLNAHKKRHQWPHIAKCPAAGCDLSFSSRRKLDLHLKIHDDVEAPYNCWTCRKKYYSANCIASHNRTHKHNENDFKCPYTGCGKKYDKVCRLKQHIRFHTGERPYSCPEEGCKWSFVSASKLTRHMRKHTGERKFVCTEPGCGKSFMRPEHLKGHVIIHTGAKPFKCTHDNCTAKFTAKSSLYVHMKKHCKNEIKVIYPCPVELCAKEYNTKTTLKQHMQKMHRNVPHLDSNVQTAPMLTRLSKAPVNDNELKCNSPVPKIITRIKPKTVPPKENLPKIVPQSPMTSLASSTETSNTALQKTNEAQQSNHSLISKFKEEENLLVSVSCGPEVEIKSSKLFQENHSGSARTDYCFDYLTNAKKLWPVQNVIRLGLLNKNNKPLTNMESSTLPLNPKAIDKCSNDAVLASCVLYQDKTSDQLEHEQQFLSEEGSVIYQDGILINSFIFSELPLTSFMCDYNDNSNDSVANMSFTGHNAVDEFSDPALGLSSYD